MLCSTSERKYTDQKPIIETSGCQEGIDGSSLRHFPSKVCIFEYEHGKGTPKTERIKQALWEDTMQDKT